MTGWLCMRSVSAHSWNAYILSTIPLCQKHRGEKSFAKIHSFFALVINQFLTEQKIAIDEPLVPWKGRLAVKQYIPLKRAWFGLKSYELCESGSGYIKRWPHFIKNCPDLSKRSSQKGITPSSWTIGILLWLCIDSFVSTKLMLSEQFNWRGRCLEEKYFNGSDNFLFLHGSYGSEADRQTRSHYPLDLPQWQDDQRPKLLWRKAKAICGCRLQVHRSCESCWPDVDCVPDWTQMMHGLVQEAVLPPYESNHAQFIHPLQG